MMRDDSENNGIGKEKIAPSVLILSGFACVLLTEKKNRVIYVWVISF